MSRANSSFEIIQLISEYIPNEYRILFLKNLLEVYGSIYKTSKITNISRTQLYRYLATEKKCYPNDEVTARIIQALLEIKRAWTKDQLRGLAKEFSDIVNKI